VPKAEHIDLVRIVQQFVHDAVGAVNYLPDGGVAEFRNRSALLREIADGKRAVYEFVAEALGALRGVSGNEADNLPQILP
jgi:hypothetical protein